MVLAIASIQEGFFSTLLGGGSWQWQWQEGVFSVRPETAEHPSSGCPECDADETLTEVREGVWIMTVHHDPRCPFCEPGERGRTDASLQALCLPHAIVDTSAERRARRNHPTPADRTAELRQNSSCLTWSKPSRLDAVSRGRTVTWTPNPNPKAPDFAPGNQAAVRHGAYSERQIEAKAAEVRSHLLDLAPWLDHDEFAPAVARFLRARSPRATAAPMDRPSGRGQGRSRRSAACVGDGDRMCQRRQQALLAARPRSHLVRHPAGSHRAGAVHGGTPSGPPRLCG